jgi:E3 ubiquitin-protein ligase listerin
MSKRPFKSHASSSRAVSGAGFGGFGSSATGSTLCYLTEPPNLSSIDDANVIVNFKNLSKKDGTTKSKALEDLVGYVREGSGPEESILEAWVRLLRSARVIYMYSRSNTSTRSNSTLASL